MPRAPKKCGRLECQTRVTGRTYCDLHEAEQQARANTTQRGYGYTHQLERDAAIAAMPDGQLCGRCHKPMHRSQRLHLDHTDNRAAYRGLAHAWCNVRAGAHKRRGGTPTPGLIG